MARIRYAEISAPIIRVVGPILGGIPILRMRLVTVAPRPQARGQRDPHRKGTQKRRDGCRGGTQIRALVIAARRASEISHRPTLMLSRPLLSLPMMSGMEPMRR